MRNVNVLLSQIGKHVLDLGFAGDSEHTRVAINCSTVSIDYPDAEAQLVVKPPSGDPYLAVTEFSDGTLIWDVSASDTAVSGSGEYQIIFTNALEDEEIFRSEVGNTLIKQSLDGATGDAPTPAETWAEAMTSELEEQIAAAANAIYDSLNMATVVVDCGTISTLPITLNAEGVTANHKAIAVELGTPTVMTSALTVTTGDGTITLTGTKESASTTCTVTLIKATNTVTATEEEEEEEEST